jgi:hypothetical protein
MNAHSQIADIIKVEDAGSASGIHRLCNHCTYNNFRAAGLVHKGLAQMIVVLPEFFEALSHGGLGENGTAGYDDAGRFAASVRIDHTDAIH